MKTELSLNEALKLIALTKFSAFSEEDFYAFSGAESEDPVIGYNGEFTIVIDGETINIIHESDETGGQLLRLSEY
jgi:hypothetical protein